MDKLVSPEKIGNMIHQIRGKKVILDKDLAKLYGVKTKVLIQAVKRNAERFPDDFIYHLTRHDVIDLRSQFVTSSWGGRRYLPYAFTEQGVAMLSSVLKSRRAIQVNIMIMRAFIKIREIITAHKDLLVRIETLEKQYAGHDKNIRVIFDAIKKLLEPPEEKPKPKIGFRV